MAFQFLQGLPELARFVPFVDAGQEVLFAYFATHNQVVGPQVVQLLARTVCSILQDQHKLFQVVLVKIAKLHNLLPLL